MWRRLLVLLFAAALIAAGCGDSDDSTTDDAATATSADDTSATTSAEDTTAEDTTATTTEDTTATTAEDTTATTTEDSASDGAAADLQLASSDVGEILVDSAGNTVYLFVPDEQGDSTCYDECEAAWPVVGEVSTVGDGLDTELVGTTERTTGDVQATYNGWPLYYFANDAAPGDVNGQGVNDVWFVLGADGAAIGAS